MKTHKIIIEVENIFDSIFIKKIFLKVIFLITKNFQYLVYLSSIL